MTNHSTTCRSCGAQGVEDSDIDPAPGVCPSCLNSRMAVVTQRVIEHGMKGAWDGLKWAGLSDDAATDFLVDLAILAGNG